MFVEAREVFGIVGGFGAAANGKGGQAGGVSKRGDKAEPNVLSVGSGGDAPEKDGEGEGAAAEVKAVDDDRVEEKQVSEDHGFVSENALFSRGKRSAGFKQCFSGLVWWRGFAASVRLVKGNTCFGVRFNRYLKSIYFVFTAEMCRELYFLPRYSIFLEH